MGLPELTNTVIPVTIASLANSVANASSAVDNRGLSADPHFNASIVLVKITTGTVAPVIGGAVNVYLLSENDVGQGTDGWVAGPILGFDLRNAPLLGSLIVTAATSEIYIAEFDTSRLGALGVNWGVAIENKTGQTLGTSAAGHVVSFRYWTPDG